MRIEVKNILEPFWHNSDMEWCDFLEEYQGSDFRGVVLVKKESDIPVVHQALIEQDNSWTKYKHLIKVCPKGDITKKVLKELSQDTGKTNIWRPKKFIKSLAEKGIEAFCYAKMVKVITYIDD